RRLRAAPRGDRRGRARANRRRAAVDAPRRARGAGARDARVRRDAPRRRADPGGDLRRALHLFPRGRRRRARRRLPAFELPGMARRDGLDRPIRRRRSVAVLLFLVVIATVAGVSVAAVRKHTTKAAPTTTVALPPPPKQFHVVFPEGFTREQMGERVKAVAKI